MPGHRPRTDHRSRPPVPDCGCSECRKRQRRYERQYRYDIHMTTHRGSSTVTREIVAGGIVLAFILAGLGLLVPVVVVALVLGTIYMIVRLQSRRHDERVRAGLDDAPSEDDVIREAHVLPDGRCSYCYALASVHVGGDGRLQDVAIFHGFRDAR